MKSIGLCTALAALLHVDTVLGQNTCSSKLKAQSSPTVALGYAAHLVANDLNDPRHMKFDSEGALLVVEQGRGVLALDLTQDDDGCISEKSRQLVVEDSSLNHGIEISPDGETLYASSPEAVFSWTYDAASKSISSSSRKTLVTNMTNSDHTTRTLLLSKGHLVVTRGSTSNIDPLASDLSSGHSQIKAFALNKTSSSSSSSKPYDFNSDGRLLGWGLRNDVGIAEEPVKGGLWAVENSVDEMSRNGKDIHNSNPAEELNFLGSLDSPSNSSSSKNFGYPECYTAWNATTIPDFTGETGDQFVIGTTSPSNNSDDLCTARQAPRLSFHPHTAPLDIKFNDAGTQAWLTFHGSWNSDVPVGYKLSVVEFAGGEPTHPRSSKTAARDVVSDEGEGCPGDCLRPVGLAWDREGRLFMSSDATGEVWVVLREEGGGLNDDGHGDGQDDGQDDEEGVASVASMSFLAVVFATVAFFV